MFVHRIAACPTVMALTATTAGVGPPITLTLVLAFTCLAIVLIAGVLVLGLFVTLRRRRAKGSPKVVKPHDD